MSETAVVFPVPSADPPVRSVVDDGPTRFASVDLFAGAGGLALGCQTAGFDPLATVERDRWAWDTIRENKERGHKLVANWKVYDGDVRDFDWSQVTEHVDLVAGGHRANRSRRVG